MKDYATVLKEAHQAGIQALNQASKSIYAMYVKDRTYGPCGMAWITIKTGTSFSKFIKEQSTLYFNKPLFEKRALNIYPGEGCQSLELNYAYCKGYANVLKAHGIQCELHFRQD